jgi:two-component system sensor histidine kinase KdpD
MTKLGAGASSTKREEQILEDLVGSVLNRLRPDLKNRQIVTHLPETLPMVLVDGLLVEQLLANLLENALKYTPPGSPIEISAVRVGDFVRVDVSDHGPGLEAGSQERVFEKFYRGKRDAQRNGAGLGLAICRGVVEAHGGRIWAENRPEGGAQFSFTLPSAPTSPHPMTGEAPHV